jgi:2-keto-4-pentenoate hydratase/2-oxohepta-3-ene-1,7-dioic acid hydratase in catechol pathway
MKLANVATAQRRILVAQSAAGQLADVGELLGRPELDIYGLIDEAPSALDALADRLHAPIPDSALVDASTMRWLPPSPRPSKIVGVAINNSMGNQYAHRAPVEPAYFLKPPSALTGHGEPIVVPAEYGLTHPEPELAAVIGRRAQRVGPADARAVVFGYTIVNDITSPALKDRDSMELVPPFPLGSDLSWRETHGEDDQSLYLTYHARSKGCDTFAPMGPWITTASEVASPNDLRVRCRLNDELVLTDSTANLLFGVDEVIAHLSHYMTLEPGDVVHFGTAFRPADPDRFPTIRHLDLSQLEGTLSVEIDGLGRLDNPIARNFA